MGKRERYADLEDEPWIVGKKNKKDALASQLEASFEYKIYKSTEVLAHDAMSFWSSGKDLVHCRV